MIVLLLASLSLAQAAILSEFNCTSNDGSGFKYTPTAVACSNAQADAYCNTLYKPAVPADVPPLPEAGGVAQRPFNCYTSTGADGPPEPAMVKAAVSSCAKTCGYCCQTPEYNCRNVQFPRLNCATITASQCRQTQWRTIIAQDCPSACGFCNEGGCVDGVLDCSNDLSICNAVGMQDFVNQYCQKTCARCSTSTTRSSGGGSIPGQCTSFIADSSTACRAWANNGFCTNEFYTLPQRRAYCATTCRIC